jgi:hypothetical protein
MQQIIDYLERKVDLKMRNDLKIKVSGVEIKQFWLFFLDILQK